MILDQIFNFTKTLIEKTTANEIHWQTLSSLSPVESGFPDIVQETSDYVFTNEFRQILPHNSFYFYHQAGVVALIRIDNESGRDGTHSNEYALYLQIRKNCPPEIFNNESFQEQFDLLNTAIINYHSKELSMPDELYKFMQF